MEEKRRVVASHTPPTGDLACNPGMCPRLGIEPGTFDLQASTQPLSHTSQGSLFFVGVFGCRDSRGYIPGLSMV